MVDKSLYDSDGVLSDRSGSTVFKPCKKAEIEFYESASSYPEFAYYIPKYMGTLSLVSDVDAALLKHSGISDQHKSGLQEIPDALVVEKAWAPSGGGKITTDSAIVLENVAEKFRRPNILDVKLGARLWADDAPPAKREKMEREAKETTSEALGLRIAGMRIWEGIECADQGGRNVDGYRAYDKFYGRNFTPETVHRGFEDFFLIQEGQPPDKNIQTVIRKFIKDLEGLQLVLEAEESRIYSSSLLFVYEGEMSALQDAIEHAPSLVETSTDNDMVRDGGESPNNVFVLHEADGATIYETDETDGTDESDGVEEWQFSAIQALKLIDFAHAQWTPGQGADENLLHGIKNVIKILRNLIKSTT